MSLSSHSTVNRNRAAVFLPAWPVSREALSLSMFHLTHLLRAGVGLDDALQEVQLLEQGSRLRALWFRVASRVRSGECLSEALRASPEVADDVLVAIIQAGESSGELAIACASCSELLDWNATTRSRMVTALIYPVFALLVLSAVVVFLFVSVVPSLTGFLEASRTELQWHTQALLLLSSWLGTVWLPVVAACFIAAFGICLLRRVLTSFRRSSDRFLLSLPVIGLLITELSLSRYAGICGRLYRSGVDLDQSLHISVAVLRNTALQQSFSRMQKSVVTGSSLAEAVQRVPGLPATFRRLLAAGESTGALGQALAQAADQHQRHAQHQLDRIERLAGPVTLLVVGVNLLWIIISVLGPVYESAIDAVLLS